MCVYVSLLTILANGALLCEPQELAVADILCIN